MTVEKRYLVDEYLDLYQDLVKKTLGEKNIVLLQNGMFYEIYNYRNPLGPNLNELSNLLDCQIGKKNRDVGEISRNNYEMIGFPMHSQEKFIVKLLNSGYVIAIYDQVQNGVKNVERKLVEIISPSTNINYCRDKDNNYLMSIYLEPHKNNRDEFYICAYSFIDVSTGENYINETSSRQSDFQYGIERLYQSIKLYNPHEILFNINTEHLNGNDWIYNKERLLNDLEIIADSRTYHYYIDKIDKNIFKLSYQNSFLANVFHNKSMLSPIEYLDLEKYPNAIVSYILLLNFAKQHRIDIIDKISKPQLIDKDDQLLLTQSSIYQLNIVSDKNQITLDNKNNCLLNILNNCSTTFGKRHFKHRLLNPITNIDSLKTMYNAIELLKPTYKDIDKYLTQIMDLERLYRRLALKILTPNELYNTYISSLHVYNLILHIQNNIPNLVSISIELINSYKDFIDLIINRYDIESLKNSGRIVDTSIFKNGFYDDIDKVDKEVKLYIEGFNYIANTLSQYIDKKNGEEDKILVSVERNDKEGRYLELTKKRWENIKPKVKNLKLEYKGLHFSIDDCDIKSHSLASIKISGGNLQIWNKNINDRRIKLISLINIEHIKLLEQIDNTYHTTLKKITKFIANIDIAKSHTINAINMNLTQPIIDENSDSSYLIASELRHPIVERINTKTPFITNDIELGKDTKQIICYGYNAVGKTTLQKAICIAIIMAQSGGYVACKQFTYKPYKYIFTRIGNTDNLLKNQSSFMVEMSELKYILKNANNNSLVCIDELVASTERFSGISLVCASILELYKRNSSVFMATHLHEISTMEKINKLPNIKILHLQVHYDNNTKTLIYDRKLKDGSGTGLYGLEVAKYLDLDKDFMNVAFTIRNELLGNDIEVYHSRQSNYNKNLYLHKCEICGYKPNNDMDIPLETHHIHFQCCANKTGQFENLGFHKNIEHNLVSLCKKCHTNTHNNIYTIHGYISTTEGYKLNYTTNNTIKPTETLDTQLIKNRGKKLTTEQVIFIQSLLDKHNDISTKKFIENLNKELNIKISYNILKKIKNNTY